MHKDLQRVMHEAIKEVDFTVIFGYRTAEQQAELYKRGRALVDGKWIIVDKKKIVTYKDGYKNKSRHQLRLAVDIVPYHDEYPHIRWDDIEAFEFLGGYILGVADQLREQGEIDSVVEWGGHWSMFKDFPHFQV